MPTTLNCGCSVTTSKKESDGVTRQWQCHAGHAVAWVGSGRLRENALPRHQQPTCLMLITVHSQHVCRTCFVLCSVFAMEALADTSTWVRKNHHYASSPIFPASALFASRTSTCPRRRQVRWCRTHLSVAKLLSAMSVQTPFFLPTCFRLSPFWQKKV